VYQSCESYTEARQYLEQYRLENIGNEKMEITTMASVGTVKTLQKGILIQNVISKMRLLRSATTTSPVIVDGGM
jgi:uridine phosphorylase